jgi:diamine N-acetyltransferase
METNIPGVEVQIVPEEDLWQVRELAFQIFPVTYKDIVDPRQIDYMMDLIYSPEALVAQLDSGQIFLIVSSEGNPIGFASYTRLNPEGDFKLNKIYLDNRLQGKGLGKWLLNDIISRVKAEGARALLLNVNRHNNARGFYIKMGFSILKEELIDIGSGYYMDDYIMELKF